MDRMEAVLVKNNENEKAANSGKKPKYVKKIITETDDDNKSFFHREWY